MYSGLTTVMWALVDHGPGQGGFGCVPGSHKADEELPEWVPPEWVREVPVAAGSVLLFTEALTHIPEQFTVNPKIARQLASRREEMEARRSIDWGFAEALAFGSLLLEGTPVRLSGQDSRRATSNATQTPKRAAGRRRTVTS